jgi:hypothetical protein
VLTVLFSELVQQSGLCFFACIEYIRNIRVPESEGRKNFDCIVVLPMLGLLHFLSIFLDIEQRQN